MRTIVLTAEEIREAVPMPAAIAAVRAAFVGLAAGEFELPVRTALADGAFLTMSAHHRPSRSTVVKSVSLDFDRRPAVQGAVLWTSMSTSDILVMDAGAVTSLRTGAVVGVATDLLAPPDARHLVLIGLGGQAPDQLRAVQAVRPIERVTLVDRDAALAESFRERCAVELADVAVRVSAEVDTSVADADVVCCGTPATRPLFEADALAERVHVNAIGAYRLTMRELPDELLATSLLVVDQREAALEESGEIYHAISEGHLGPDDLVELGSLLQDRQLARPDRTVFKSVGLGIQDWAVGQAVASLVTEPHGHNRA